MRKDCVEENKPKASQEAEKTQKSEESSPPSGKPEKEYRIDIFRDWCKCCGICAAFCPRQCIEMDENGIPIVIHPDQCTGCGWCELHCPDFAISVRPKNLQPRVGEANY